MPRIPFILSNKMLLVLCAFLLLWLEQPNLPFGLNDIGYSHAYYISITLITLITLLIMGRPPSSYATTAPSEDQKVNQQWFQRTLRQHFKQIQKHYKQLFWAKNQRTVLVLGLDHIGKQAILSKCATRITSDPEPIHLAWWQQPEQLLCVGSPRIHPEQTAQHCASLWHRLCSSLRLRRLGTAFDELVIMFHMPALHSPHEVHQARDVDQINAALAPILDQHRQLPTRIIFTQADFITGFNETFTQLDTTQRQQPWYIDCRDATTPGLDGYEKAFDQWLATLNTQLIQRLHQEPCQQRRTLIKDFPLQLLRLKQPIQQLLAQLCFKSPEQLQSIHFCSTEQTSQPFDYLTNDLAKVPCKTSPTTHASMRLSIFAEPVFNTLPSKKILAAQEQPWYSLTSTCWAAVVAIGLLAASHVQYLHMHQLKTEFSQHQQYWATPSFYRNAIPWRLARIARQDLDSINAQSRVFNWLFPQINRHKQQLSKQYQQLLTQKLIPAINQSLAIQLSTQQTQSTQTQALYIIKQLQNKSAQANPTPAVLNWLHRQFGLSHSAAWVIHLVIDLSKDYQPTALLKQQLQRVQTQLAELPVDQQAILMALAPSQGQFHLPGINAPLNRAYAPETLTMMTNTTLIQQCKVIDDQQTNLCSTRAKHRYYKLYAHYWLTKIQHPELLLSTAPNSTFSKQYQDCTKAQQSIAQVLLTLKQQPDLPNRLNKAMQQAYRDWQDLQQTDQQSSSTLTALIQQASQADFSEQNQIKAFNMLATLTKNPRASKQTSILPKLTKPWVQYIEKLAKNSLVKAAKAHINSVWMNTIWPVYLSTIAHHYPFDPKAPQAVSLQQFADFFAPEGQLDHFIKQYVWPFAYFNGQQWQARSHAALHFDKKHLEQFALVQWIQQMYFHDGHVPLIAFNLIPHHIPADIKTVRLSLGQRRFDMSTGHESAIASTWPLPGEDTASIELTNQAGEKQFLSAHGPWAWFKLLTHATLKRSLEQPQQFFLTFKINGYEAGYVLIADAPMNPFIFNVFPVLKLPRVLT